MHLPTITTLLLASLTAASPILPIDARKIRDPRSTDDLSNSRIESGILKPGMVVGQRSELAARDASAEPEPEPEARIETGILKPGMLVGPRSVERRQLTPWVVVPEESRGDEDEGETGGLKARGFNPWTVVPKPGRGGKVRRGEDVDAGDDADAGNVEARGFTPWIVVPKPERGGKV